MFHFYIIRDTQLKNITKSEKIFLISLKYKELVSVNIAYKSKIYRKFNRKISKVYEQFRG